MTRFKRQELKSLLDQSKFPLHFTWLTLKLVWGLVRGKGNGRGLTGSKRAREDLTDCHLATDSREEEWRGKREGVERGD